MGKRTVEQLQNPQSLAQAVADAMWSRDHAAQALGIRIESVGPGCASLLMDVRQEMLNGHNICHGGMIFTLADTSLPMPAMLTIRQQWHRPAQLISLRLRTRATHCAPRQPSVPWLAEQVCMTSPSRI